MGKKKARMSLFSTFVQQINEDDSPISSNDYHLIDNEYFAGFNSLDDIEKFHTKLTEKQQEQSMNIDLHTEDDSNEMNMKTFAQQYLIDLPEHLTKVTENLNLSPTSSQDIFTTDQPINWSPKIKANNHIIQSPDNKKRKSSTPVKRNTKKSRQIILNSLHSSPNIFDCLQAETSSNQIAFENINSILFTLNDKQSSLDTDLSENSIAIELAEPSIIKSEPIESEQLMVKPKEEPIEINTVFTSPMGEFSGDLDQYVQNIHLLHSSSNLFSTNSSRPKRIRKQNKYYIEESEVITKPKKVKKHSSTFHLTDAEIEQQFGERLPIIKQEHDENTQQIVNSRIIIQYEPVNHLSPIEKARAKLTTALQRGHDPDTYLLKIRSREHKIIEVQLAIYSTADWYSHRAKILPKIEEALRGLRVSWTKIDIHVDDFDIEISTSLQAATISPPSLNTNSSWFLKGLSESGRIIVHIHDRKYPQQRLLIKCSCPECSPTAIKDSIDSSLPVIVNVSPVRTPTRHLTSPTILNKTQQTTISSLHNIDTTFFNELISQSGRNTVISVTQCVLDLALIVSVHASLPNLCVSPNSSKEEYKKQYQQIIDPLKCTLNENEQNFLSKTPMIARVISGNSIILSKSPDILPFYHLIKQNKANIRNAKSMRNLIMASFSTPRTSSESNVIKAQTLILPKLTSSVSLSNSSTALSLIELRKMHELNHRSRRFSFQTNRYDKHYRAYIDSNEIKQQAHCTPIIELKPIMGGSPVTTQNIHSFSRENNQTIVIRDAQNNELKKITTIAGLNQAQQTIGEITSPPTNSARVIRFSIAKSALPNAQRQSNSTSPPTIRLVASPKTDADPINPSHSIASINKGEAAPLVPKQINIIKPITSSSSVIPAIKLSNPILISNKPQLPSMK